MSTIRVAVVQEPPAVLDAVEGVHRAAAAIARAAAEGARIVAFPETWLTGYPAWIFGLAGWDDAEARHWYARLVNESVTLDSPLLNPVREAAAAAGVAVVLGINERQGPHSGTLFNSLLMLGSEGQTVGVHRKLTPTHTERIVWGAAPDGSGLRAYEVEGVRLGGLVCWEHWHPLIRQAMHDEGEQIHVAAWPDMTEAHSMVSRTYAFEGRCFVLAAAQYLRAEDVPEELRDAYRLGVGPGTPESGTWFAGGSAIAGPDGRWVTDPLFDESGLVVADLDLELTIASKHDLDVVGHYARPDILALTVDRRSRPGVQWMDDPSDDGSDLRGGKDV